MLERLPDATRVAVLGFAAAVACYDLARTGCPASLALPGEGVLTEALVRIIRQRAPCHLASLSACRQAAISAVQSMRLVCLNFMRAGVLQCPLKRVHDFGQCAQRTPPLCANANNAA